MLNKFHSLCTPAQLYLGLSVLSIIAMGIQNCGDASLYKCGLMTVQSPVNNVFYFAFKILYVLVWTYLLNVLCGKGYSKLSWLLVLFPFIAMFVIIGLLFVSLKNM